MRLKGKVAVVTAAGQGIGRAIADRLAAEGAVVHASDLRPNLLADFCGGSVAALDATDHAACARYIGAIARIDVLVHAVGYVHQGTIEQTTPEEWRRSTAITLDSAFNVIQPAIARMRDHGGSIITIASVASSTKGFARRAAYGAAKGGVIGLTKAIAADYLRQNIRANALCPGTVDSPSLRERIAALVPQMGSLEAAEKVFLDRQPSGRLGRAEEIAGMAAFLASDDAVFVTGQVINVDGGITI